MCKPKQAYFKKASGGNALGSFFEKRRDVRPLHETTAAHYILTEYMRNSAYAEPSICENIQYQSGRSASQ